MLYWSISFKMVSSVSSKGLLYIVNNSCAFNILLLIIVELMYANHHVLKSKHCDMLKTPFKQRVLKINILRYDKFHSSGFTQRLTKGCVHETAGKLICFIITKRYQNSC